VTASHRFEESDELRLSVEADSFAELLTEAARALSDLAKQEPSPVPGPDRVAEIVVQARDSVALLVEWLNEIIGRAESEGWLASRFEVLELSPGLLRVRACGSPWPSRSFPVKAATLDRALVRETATGWRAEVTLDV
jgi:SHS2 domain-containing protein